MGGCSGTEDHANDETQGDRVLPKLGGGMSHSRFWMNGVHEALFERANSEICGVATSRY